MMILSKQINFGNSSITTRSNGIRTTEEFNDSDLMISQTVYDETNDRFISQSKFDEKGPVEKWWFEYDKDKKVEHFESRNGQSYVRTIVKKIANGLQLKTEEYVSSEPSKNYLYEITRDMEGHLKSFLCNGKKVF